MTNDIGGIWRTVGGHKVFIKSGQDLSSAMKESGKFGRKENKNANISERKKDDVLVVKGKSLISKEKAFEQIKSEEYKNEIKKFIDKENEGNLAFCEETSEKVANDFKNVGIDAKSVDVTVYSDGRLTSTNGHSVTEANNKLYDFTGNQYFGKSTSKDVELKVYEEVSKGIYSEKKININDKMSGEEKIININKYTEKNPNSLILYKSEKSKDKK